MNQKIDDEICLFIKNGIVDPIIFISGSRFLAIPSRVINWVNKRAKLPSNLIPCFAAINKIPWIAFPTLMSGSGCLSISSKWSYSCISRLILTF